MIDPTSSTPTSGASSAAAAPPRPPTPAPLLAVAWRQLWRDFRAGELRLLLVAVALAVAALTSVSFFADRLNNGLARDARQLIGADAVIGSDLPLPPAFEAAAREMGLQVARTAAFPSMARATDAQGGASKLASVKGVSQNYPLRGAVMVADAPDGAPQVAQGGPPPGSVWVDPGLLEALALKVGDTVLLGEAALRIAKVITLEPDRGGGFMSFSPRVMLHYDDLAATRLIQPASRVSYRLAVAARDGRGGDTAVQGFIAWADEALRVQNIRGARVDAMQNGRPEMRQTLDRAQKFLNLVALLAALLAAVAVGIAARDLANRHLDDCAMLRVLGQPQRRIAGAYLLEFATIGLIASVLGVLVGLAVQQVFVWLLSGLVKTQLPPPGLWPAAFGLGVGLTLLLGFGAPPVLQLARVPPLRVIRRDLGELKPASLGVLLAGMAGFAGLLVAVAADPMMGAIAVAGFAVAVALFALLSWLAVQLLRRTVPEARAPRWLVLATRQIAARPGYAVLQVSALSVGLLALVLLVLLRTDLIASWRAATPANAPNRFVINIQPEQGQVFQRTLADAGVPSYDWYPMIRARLLAVNGTEVSPDDYIDERAKRLVDREFNLSHAARMPEHNKVVAGTWTDNEPGAVSVEEGIAETLNLKLGDSLRFDITGNLVEARITSLRKVDWGSMRANFFVMFPRQDLPDLPATFIAAFRAPGTPGFDNALSRDYPNVTVVDVSAQIVQVQRVLDQVIRAVEFLFAFTLATGLTVLFAAVTATREARSREFALMRAMGAGSELLSRVQRAELLGVGALAGFLASTAAIAVGWALARFAFEFSWTPSPWVPLIGSVVGALLALSAGWWGLRGVLTRPVVQTLRQAAE
jgi:putative ABC transport system permease protein